jgi:hypothetical protein
MAKKEYGTRKKYHFIYKTTNLLSGRYYIGMHSTDDLNDGYLGSGTYLKRSINKHGKENHSIEILEFLNSREELAAREREIVSLQEIAKKECMNLKVGGEGGFTVEQAKKGRQITDKVLEEKHGKDFRVIIGKQYYENLSEEQKQERNALIARRLKEVGFDHATFKGKKHSEETLNRMREVKVGHGKGVENSQFGKCWITDETENKKVHKGDPIPEGWRLGRKLK